MNRIVFGLVFALAGGAANLTQAAEGEKPVDRVYVTAPSAPQFQSWEQAEQKSAGCVSCHESSDLKTMHRNPAVILGCTDCHGGDATVMRPPGTGPGAPGHGDGKHDGKKGHAAGAGGGDDHGGGHATRIYEPSYRHAMEEAHVLPSYPQGWHYPSSANPKHSYTLLNREAPEFVRFVNPSDYRIVHEACGACHLQDIEAAKRSLMSTGAMLWGGGAYNNGILPFKNYILGEGYTRDSQPAAFKSLIPEDATDEFRAKLKARGVIEQFVPLPAFEVTPPGDVFRIFERGGRNIINLFPEIGLPNALGQTQRLEEPGRPDIRQSNRGPGTGLRVAVPVLNITKTRLNDPFTWFLGSNDNPGDFRTSGCGSCHVVYANNREEKASGPYARDGHWGETKTVDPTIPHGEEGHPLKHEFTRAVPTAQCMNCHMHQPNIFLNSYLGYTMWDYESDAPSMWPEKQKYPTSAEDFEVLMRNPEEAATRGKWADIDFVRQVYDMNPELKNTQFADYHGHGWNFRGIFKKDRKGNLLTADGEIVEPDDPKKWEKAVHMSSIHADKGMHCIDCHFTNDGHGNGYIYAEVANAVEIRCKDCHGTVDSYPTLRTSGPAARPGGMDLSVLRTQDGRLRFEYRGDDCEMPLDQRVDCKLYQRPSLWGTDMPDPTEPTIVEALGEFREWEVSLVRSSVNPGSPGYNEKAARAKLMARDKSMEWGWGVAGNEADRAHRDDDMMCFTCHLSWTTSCAGCHLPIQANRKMPRLHYEGGVTRNFATYNPQVVRDQMFQLGRHQTTKGNAIAPIRSTSALVLSSKNINRERIYIQQPPVAASGYSSQAFAPHFPHTVRLTETKTCTDCHLSSENDNNAIMAQLLLHGTNFVNFVGFNAWVGGDGGFEAVTVTEWEEPQAVVGSYLQKYAYPDWYREHQERGKELPIYYTQSGWRTGCIQLRGEYLYVAEGSNGFQVYDVASIANKGISDRIITAPFGPLGHDTRVETTNATCVVLPTNQPIHPDRLTHDFTGQRSDEEQTKLMLEDNQEQPFHPIYDYAFVTDSVEGLIAVDVNTLSDGEPRNNFLERAVTWNAGGVLDGARHLTIAGYYFYVTTDKGVVVLNMDDPLQPKVVSVIEMRDVRATALQFRYLFVTDAEGFKVVDVTNPEAPRPVDGAVVPLKNGQRIYVARTYAYVAAGSEGLAIIDVERPEQPKVYQMYTAGGQLNDAYDVVVGSTNASLFAYVADGVNGMKVLQLTSPDSQPRFYGYSPEPKPELIAWRKTNWPAISVSKGLDRDRAVDETGGQMAVLGRLGSRPFTLKEQREFYLNEDMSPWTVTDEVEKDKFMSGAPSRKTAEGRHKDDRAQAPAGSAVQ
ncbi:MAG: hypothetical protein RIM84_14925 [Alphaproteobacteria bacterium]